MNRTLRPPRVALSLCLCAVAWTCAHNHGQRRPNDTRTDGVDAIARAWAKERDFNGVIMASAPGRPPYRFAAGKAGPGDSPALNPNTRFQTGSIDKYFAAIAVFQLVEEGVLDLDAPISELLSDYRSDTGQRLTLRRLLSNQSGLPNDILQVFQPGTDDERNAIDAMTVKEAASHFASGDLAFAPGARFDYVLSNWLLVQHVLEEATGSPYPRVRAKYVFEPANMRHSGGYIHDLFETDPHVDDIAIGFDPTAPSEPGDYWTPRFFKGSYTTAADLIALERALSEGRLLNDESLELFRTVQAPVTAYAFGGRHRRWDICGEGHSMSTQSGSNGATTLTSTYDTQTGHAVVILSNVSESQDAMFDVSAKILGSMSECAVEARRAE